MTAAILPNAATARQTSSFRGFSGRKRRAVRPTFALTVQKHNTDKGEQMRQTVSCHKDVHVGDRVDIALLSDPACFSSGIVHMVLSNPDSDKTVVILKDGKKGRVVSVTDSESVIRERIMREDQYAENKEKFSEKIMRGKVIPMTVQSFLNSEGGHLYIGVKDTGTLVERLVGLEFDFEQIEDHQNMTNDKLCDKLEQKIMDSLDDNLESDVPLGPLVAIRFIRVNGVQVAEINIKRSSKPWFFLNKTKGNKPKTFDLFFNNEKVDQRTLDDFYIRLGGGKKRLSTHAEFYKYSRGRFS